jgi:WD40 repeat protein
LEAVSARLKDALIHPNRTGALYGLRYAPDGRRVIAGDYPGGVVQVWDAATGKQLTKIETGYGYRGSAAYFFLTPDWGTLFVARQKRQATRVERDGKRLTRWQFDGDVRAWDLATGELRATYRHSPARGTTWMELAPDGGTFVTFEEVSGESDRGPGRAASLWDVRTKRPRPLPNHVSPLGVYAPDSKTLAVQAVEEQRVTAVQLIDVGTAREKLSIPIAERDARGVGYLAFSPDGALLVGQLRDEVRTGQHWLKFWDRAGREVASFAGEPRDYFLYMAFSCDGRTLAVTNRARGGAGAKLFLFDLAGRTLQKAVALGEQGVVYPPAFSPDGRWVAVATLLLPKEAGDEALAEDLPQPRIHLVEVAAGAVRETLVAPQGFPTAACFSPDGKTLATSGSGRVLLWDLTKPPLGAGAGSQ